MSECTRMLSQNYCALCVRTLFFLVFLVAAFATLPARAASDLYRGKTIVTGQREESRIPGFSKCLEDVLVKVSGDPRLIGDPKAQAILARAAQFVSSYHYHDRLEGLP